MTIGGLLLTEDLEALAKEMRARLVEMSHNSGACHLAGCLSCVDVLVALYWEILRIDPENPKDPNRDRFIMSKGHAAQALYTTLAMREFCSEKDLEEFCQAGSKLTEHPSIGSLPGIEAATGSLGHGLGLGLGMAYAAKLRQLDYRTFVLLSDGECNEGSIWEAAMMAPQHGLDNLVAFIDFNKWQAIGRSTEVLALEPFADKWKAFGWMTQEIDGHNMDAVVSALKKAEDADRPAVIVAHTIKGKGVSFMEDDNNWHYRIPTAQEVQAAHQELGVNL